MNRHGNNDPSKSPMFAAELKFLRARVAQLESQARAPAPVAAETQAPRGPVVEHRPDLRVQTALRDLLVAAENYFGPDELKITPKPSRELQDAMTAAEKLVRKEKKP